MQKIEKNLVFLLTGSKFSDSKSLDQAFRQVFTTSQALRIPIHLYLLVVMLSEDLFHLVLCFSLIVELMKMVQ